ncbi:MAG: acetyl-CoA carboxylase biotin carboxyl carrier protein subunit [Proteobacteria bacterium]|nr:acetyl-CoA carboxylase biotin carboxyl carrier protein subunit [Pseudomonadota bacterium]
MKGDTEGTPLKSPMPGIIVSYKKQVGDSVNTGEIVVILEAMKMENALPSPAGGIIKSINFASGDPVARNDVLCVIG